MIQRSGEQLPLFDSGNYATPEKRPGQKSLDEWIATENPVYHGTFRSDFDQAPAAHFGTMGQATDRVASAAATIQGQGRRTYYDPSFTDDDFLHDGPIDGPEPTEHVGRVYARRLTEPRAAGVYSDPQANAAQVGFLHGEGVEDFDVPRSVRDSAVEAHGVGQHGVGQHGGFLAPDWDYDTDSSVWPTTAPGTKLHRSVQRSRAGARALGAGRPIEYRNTIEGHNDHDTAGTPGFMKSVVAPSQSTTSWERDVINDPFRPDFAKKFARRRIVSGQEGAVPFPSPTIPKQPQQLTFADDYNPDQKNFPQDMLPRRVPPQRPTLTSLRFPTES
jgi:hypothetical protein